MLFVLSGSSAAGKTTVLAELAARVENLAVHDFDEIGVPEGADYAGPPSRDAEGPPALASCLVFGLADRLERYSHDSQRCAAPIPG